MAEQKKRYSEGPASVERGRAPEFRLDSADVGSMLDRPAPHPLTSAMTPTTATATHRFDVPATAVFDAWLDPGAIGRWMFGPTVRDERIRHLRLDARVGGSFSFEVERGGKPIEHVGTYQAIDRPAHLAFTWGVAGDTPSTVDVTLTDTATGCDATVVHTLAPQWADAAARTQAAWTFMLGTLDRELHPADGQVRDVGHDTLRMERLLPGPVERVWDHLVDPDRRALWLAGGPMELRLGGAVELQFRHADLSPRTARAGSSGVPAPTGGGTFAADPVQRGTVTQLDPQRRLGFTWGAVGHASEVTFELIPQGTLVRLILVHSRLPDAAERRAARCGWHTHADILEDRLRGHVPEAFWTRHAAIDALYHQREHNG